MAAILAAGHAFHERFVALLGNDFLADAYQRFGVSAIWARALPTVDWARRIGFGYLRELVEACEEGDRERAHRVLERHATQVREVARSAITEAGGSL